MELAKAITDRRSIRKFLNKDVPDELLMEAFELARWAPSGGNFQSWKFLVVKNRKIINEVADAFEEKVDTFTNWPEAEEYRETAENYRKNAAFFREAPVLIVALSCGYKSVADLILSKKGEKDPLAMQMMENRRSAPTSVQQIGGFVVHLLLVLHSLGLGACWMSGPLIAKGEIEEILEVPGGEDVVACIPVGYPAESPSAKPKKTVDELVVFVR